jgi:glycosyltransferase involved in cell wall biosynthesis
MIHHPGSDVRVGHVHPPRHVSISTPSFNQARFLEATLRSVLEQDYPRLETIVVDGGSTDGRADILRRYEGRLAHCVSERDRGQADAINKGLRLVTGEIAAWLNSDDLYLPGAIRQAAQVLADPPRGLPRRLRDMWLKACQTADTVSDGLASRQTGRGSLQNPRPLQQACFRQSRLLQ